MDFPKTSKNLEFLNSLVVKKPQTSQIISQAKKKALHGTDLLIEKESFNNDMVLYAKSVTSKQR